MCGRARENPSGCFEAEAKRLSVQDWFGISMPAWTRASANEVADLCGRVAAVLDMGPPRVKAIQKNKADPDCDFLVDVDGCNVPEVLLCRELVGHVLPQAIDSVGGRPCRWLQQQRAFTAKLTVPGKLEWEARSCKK
jgi:hypothetical protein